MTELQSLCFFCMDLHFINIIKTVCLQQQQQKKNTQYFLFTVLHPNGKCKNISNIFLTLICQQKQEKKRNQKVFRFLCIQESVRENSRF